MSAVGHPHCRELIGAQQLGETDRVAPVCLYLVTGFLRNKRGSNHDALVAKALDQPVEPISCRTGLIAKRQTTVFLCKLGHEFSDRRLRGRELPKKPYLATTATFRDRHCITQF